MTQAIRPGSFVGGAIQGMQAMDRHYESEQRRENSREAIQLRRDEVAARNEQREFNRDMAQKNYAINLENSKRQGRVSDAQIANYESQNKRASEKHAWERANQQRAAKEAQNKELSTGFGEIAHLAHIGAYDSITPEMIVRQHELAVKANRLGHSPLTYSPETVRKYEELKPLMEQLEAGNLEVVNSPGWLKRISDLPAFKEALNIGVGEIGRNGSVISSKEIAEFMLAPGGRVVPLLNIKTEDGESYQAEMTAFRGTSPNEPIKTADAGVMLDHLLATQTFAGLFNNPEMQKRIASANDWINGKSRKPVKYTNIVDLAGGGKAGLNPQTNQYEKIETGDLDFADNPDSETLELKEGEAKAAGFHKRMIAAQDEIDTLGDFDYSSISERLMGMSNFTASPKFQRYRQAADDWIRAKLRKESGAVIGEQEMAKEYEVYFPQAGDSDEVIAQKARARRQAEEGMLLGAGEYQEQYLRSVADKRAQSDEEASSVVEGDSGSAPPEALIYLEQNPDAIDQFFEKYGYRPKGFEK